MARSGNGPLSVGPIMRSALLLLLGLSSLAPLALNAQERLPELCRDYADVLRHHLGSLGPAARSATDSLAALHLAIWGSAATADEQRAALEKYVKVLWPLLKLNESYRMFHDVERVVSMFSSLLDTYGDATEPDLTIHRSLQGSQDWKLDVVEVGNGTTPVLLIGSIGLQATELYSSFLQQNREAYRMFAVSFPGLMGAERQPYPERRDYSTRTWLSGFQEAIAAYLSSKKLDNVVVVGTGAGGYIAARLALDHPERFRAAVLVGTLLHTNARSPRDPDRPISPAERLEDANRILPNELMPLPRLPSEPQEVAAILRDPNRSYPGLLNFFSGTVLDTDRTIEWSARFASTYGAIATAYEYYNELYTTDLTPELRRLHVPTLVLVPGYAGTLPSTRAIVLSQWQEAELEYPDIPLRVWVLEDQPAYIATESPELFATLLDGFLAERPLAGNSTPVAAVLAAPRAEVMQTVDSLEVTVRYRRPAVGDQELWGKTVPFGRVWNPGTAKTTTISFSSNASIGGASVAPGTYALFMIPTQEDWTVILNRVPDQWQNLTYNPEFDALRLTVDPEASSHQEFLSFAFEQSSDDVLTLVWSWNEKRIELPVRRLRDASSRDR